jgi:tripartite-type tricarboxylate transporter receptor subunit TctC
MERTFLHCALAALAATLVLPVIAQAPAYPARAATFVVPFAAGSATDLLARSASR